MLSLIWIFVWINIICATESFIQGEYWYTLFNSLVAVVLVWSMYTGYKIDKSIKDLKLRNKKY